MSDAPIGIYNSGAAIVLEVMFTDPDPDSQAAVDPPAVDMTLLDPAGVETSATWPGGAIERIEAGRYRWTIEPELVGIYRYRARGAVPWRAVEQGMFRIQPWDFQTP